MKVKDIFILIPDQVKSGQELSAEDRCQFIESWGRRFKIFADNLQADAELKQDLLEMQRNKFYGFDIILKDFSREKSTKPHIQAIIGIIFSDAQLKERFLYENVYVGQFAFLAACIRPDLIPNIIRDKKIIRAIHKSSEPMHVRDILIKSQNEDLIDYFFSVPEYVMGYGEEIKKYIYESAMQNGASASRADFFAAENVGNAFAFWKKQEKSVQKPSSHDLQENNLCSPSFTGLN